VDRAQLADFLRTRREALQPEDVGLPRGPRRRTGGLRREEVAALCGMSTDYYTRIEQQRGPRPSEPMLAAIARGLHLSLDERDHLFRIAGHAAPERVLRDQHVDAGLMRVLDRLDDTPAMVISGLAETLVQNRLAVALLGDQRSFTGLDRSTTYRWFTRPESRNIYPAEDHPRHGRIYTARLREAYTRAASAREESARAPGASAGGVRSGLRAADIVDALLAASPEFAALWATHEVGLRHTDTKLIANPHVGELEVHCQHLLDVDQSQALLVFTAVPGSESHEKLALLSVLSPA
jgi:transcriptional regulator with XRE-family HTH domain